ncbi:MAG: DUF3391 domain-containing protein [Rubrivivax sp.]|nr:DUF3391 domain-containing protein [Rubrivivax sp.]
MSNLVAVHDLKVGMVVHLALGWLSHPFPLSSFRIATDAQIETIRGLGLRELRWVPEKSELTAVAAAAGAGAATGATTEPEATAAAEESAEQSASRQRAELLAVQHAALRLCEAQFAEATRAWVDTHAKVAARPVEARADTEAMTGALLDKLMLDGEVCVRLLAGAAGNGAAAHAVNVAVIALLMGRAHGLAADEMHYLGVGALLHDVGKIDVTERLRHAEAGFNSNEMAAYRDHVQFGVTQARRMGLTPGAQLVLAQHHEHADGSGFPLKLELDRMSTAARIVAIANRYDNLCNPALAERALTPHEALSTLFAQHRTRFDGTLLNAFIRMMGVYPAGSVVQLTDDRFAMVVSVNSTRPLKPRVMVHDADMPAAQALVINLEDHADLGIRRSLSPTKLPAEVHDYLKPRQRVHYFFDLQAPAVQELAA